MKSRGLLATSLALFAGVATLDWLADASRFLTFRVFAASVGLGICTLAVVYYRRPYPLVAWPAFVAAVWALTWWDHSPVKPFARFYSATHMGMTRAEVLAELDRHYDWSNSYPKPEAFSVQAGHMGFTINPPGWNDVMVVCLYFEDDRVVRRSLHDD